ncbi:MAG: 23S rRNA (guanosine-2'-O-)-methyltransferase RlmB [marine bacterium B5-7]|nr:MAG: 23S rRNA (guanosine-2'-O-)-methyltransferase RlmB [marine bacterium B5-7]
MGQDVSVNLVAGLHNVRLALENGQIPMLEILIDAGRDDQRISEIISLATKRGISLRKVAKRKLDEQAPGVKHQGVIARLDGSPRDKRQGIETILSGLDHDPMLLVLDGVKDPHNLGACLRSADGAGVDALIVPENRACGMTPVVSKVAAGAAHTVPLVVVTNIASALKDLKQRGLWIVGASDDAPATLWESDLSGPLAIVLGGEEGGLRDLTRRHCDFMVGVPMRGVVESLNVSVAAALVMYEALRQRRIKN